MQEKPLKKEPSGLLRIPLEERLTSFRQASDDKGALRGRQPTSLIAFVCLFLLFLNVL